MPTRELLAISQADLRAGADLSESKRKEFRASLMRGSLEARSCRLTLTNFCGTFPDLRLIDAATRGAADLTRDATDLPHLLTQRRYATCDTRCFRTAASRRTPWRLFALEAMMAKAFAADRVARASVLLVRPAMQVTGS